jgi:hypothetical protein
VSRTRFTALDPSTYGRTPWKNGGGVVIDIAGRSRETAALQGGWDAVLWRFGRTTIPVAAPFSDLTGFDRLLMVVEGRGLVLRTSTEEIDVREAFVPVRFAGETKIVSRLEAGPVQVVNLIADRGYAAIALERLAAGTPKALTAGIHVLYAVAGACALRCDGEQRALADGHALQVECDYPCTVVCVTGAPVVASVFPSHSPGASGKR